MHLLVLSAFRLGHPRLQGRPGVPVSMHLLVLSAFRLERGVKWTSKWQGSMHLLVLSAFRLRPQKTAPQRRLPERNRRRPGKCHIESARTRPIKPHNREKPPQTTQRRRRPLPTSTPPTSNEPKPKNRPLTTMPELTSSYWASRIPCCKVMPILPAQKPIRVYTEIKITRKHQIENQQHRIGDWVLLCVNDAETHTRLIKG